MARILVIEDEFELQYSTKLLLEHAGHEVAVAPSASTGMRDYRSNPADLVIINILMPAEEALRAIRDLHHDYPGVRVFAISAGGHLRGKSYLEIARQLGAVRTFAKPVRPYQLIQAAQELLG